MAFVKCPCVFRLRTTHGPRDWGPAFSCKFPCQMAFVKCPCAFRLRKLAQNAAPGSGVRHFSCKFQHKIALICVFLCAHICVLPYLCSHMCPLICVLLCALVCVLSYVCSHMCAPTCSHMCALICMLSYVCSHMCALICALSYVCFPPCAPMCSHVFAFMIRCPFPNSTHHTVWGLFPGQLFCNTAVKASAQ